MRNGNPLKSCVSEICIKRIHINQGVSVRFLDWDNFTNVLKILWTQMFAKLRIHLHNAFEPIVNLSDGKSSLLCGAIVRYYIHGNFAWWQKSGSRWHTHCAKLNMNEKKQASPNSSPQHLLVQEVLAFHDFWCQKGITKLGAHEFWNSN